RGTKHFKVEKSVHNGRTLSTVVPLSQKERVRELARMLAGESASEQTKAWALELLEKGTIAA
ncbi:MAG: DNA repair protein RecN, partial [Deltaproteobacteria bacterium]|nr:DNA repair protein RecN [Deltaproteobacteria bacterium]